MDQESIEEVCASEVYPKQPLHVDDNSLTVTFSLLSGEAPLFIGRTTEGTIIITSYRLYHSEGNLINVPLGVIEYVECRDIFFIHIFCKDGRSFRCSFTTTEDCQKWLKRLHTAIQTPEKLENHFGFVFYSWTKEEHKEAILSQLSPFQTDLRDDLDFQEFSNEVERMGFDLNNTWKISRINSYYDFCPSYPRFILVPALTNEKNLEDLVHYRYSRRIPAVVWRHQQNGCVIARSSQPRMGILRWRNAEDENLIQAISDACIRDPGYELRSNSRKDELVSLSSDADGEISFQDHDQSGEVPKKKLLIVDARSYAAAVTNRAKGGGYECDEYYSNCEIQYMGLANIHQIRKSFSALRLLCATPNEQNWLSSLENTRWLQHTAGLIQAALLVVNTVDTEIRPVLVHCSDGWDRTPQIVALAELMLDPFYRTKKGFKVLVEREWLDFGHKFADRCGHADGTDDTNERSPIFLQWLDCVYQVQRQFPCYFEFNQQYLARLVLHTYSCLFGTFLCNSDQIRKSYRISARTFSVWPLLNEKSQFHNYLFSQNNEVLRPSCLIRDIAFWKEVYLPNIALIPNKSDLLHIEESVTPEEATPLVKTKSCDNISNADHSSILQRRSSDPNLVDSSFPEAENFHQTDNNLEKVDDVSLELPLDTVSNMLNNNGMVEDCPHIVNGTERTDNDVSSESAINGSTDTLVSESNAVCHEHSSNESSSSEKNDSLNSKLELTSRCNGTLSTENVTQPILPNTSCGDARLSTWCHSTSVPNSIANKRSSGSSDSCSCSYTTPQHSRTPSSGFPATPCDDPNDIALLKKETSMPEVLDVDGLEILPDAVQDRIKGIVIQLKNKIASLQNQLTTTRSEFFHQVYKNCQNKDGRCSDVDDTGSVSDSACIGEQHCDSGGSENSWEQLDYPYSILWVPDHAASNCTGCKGTFWAGRRRHHCRKCGRVFCYRCSSRLMPVPTEQLFDPVRVCNFCFEDLQIHYQQSVLCNKMQKTVIAAASN